MFCVGLTGTIGSGKSSALAFFQSLGVSVLSADKIARALTARDGKAYALIKDHFGDVVLNEASEINRAALKKIIFENKEERLWLEGLLHPLIREEIEAQMKKVEAEGCAPYCVIEIPLLTRDSIRDYPYLDRVLVIQVDRGIQIQRVIQRDHCDAESALKIIQAQVGPAHLQGLADDLVLNNASVEELREKIADLHGKYSGLREGL